MLYFKYLKERQFGDVNGFRNWNHHNPMELSSSEEGSASIPPRQPLNELKAASYHRYPQPRRDDVKFDYVPDHRDGQRPPNDREPEYRDYDEEEKMHSPQNSDRGYHLDVDSMASIPRDVDPEPGALGMVHSLCISHRF